MYSNLCLSFRETVPLNPLNTNLVRNKYEEGEKISIQNISEDDIKIGANTKLIEAKIVAKKKYNDVEDWEELKERETDKKEEKESEKAAEIRYCHIDVDEEAETINKGLFRLDPESIFIGDIEIKFMGDVEREKEGPMVRLN